MTFWKRPRTLILTLLLLLGAWVIWRQSRDQALQGREAVAAWVQDAVRDAGAERDLPPAMGETAPVLANSLAAWVRETLPANMATDAVVEVTPLGQGFLTREGDAGPATHRVVVRLQGRAATLLVVWNGAGAKAIEFHREP